MAQSGARPKHTKQSSDGDEGTIQEPPPRYVSEEEARKLKIVKSILVTGDGRRSLLVRDAYGRTPIHKAVKGGHEAIAVEMVRAAGKAVYTADNDGATPLYLAASKCQFSVVKAILEAMDEDRTGEAGAFEEVFSTERMLSGRRGARPLTAWLDRHLKDREMAPDALVGGPLTIFDGNFPIEKYHKREVIPGHFEVVKRAVLKFPSDEPNLPPEVAFKIVHTTTADLWEKVSELLIASDSSPFLATVFGTSLIGTKTPSMAVIMEAYQTNLEHHLSTLPGKVLPPYQQKPILQQIGHGLKDLKEMDVFHGGIRPRNILMVSTASVPRIVIGNLEGLPLQHWLAPSGYWAPEFSGYWAPEFLADKEQGHPADVYAFGALGFEVVLGNTPPYSFREEAVNKWLREDLPKISDDDLRDLLRRCLAWDPAERIGKEEIVGHPFFRASRRPLRKEEH